MSGPEVIVIGAGGVGSAALFYLARRGVRALGLDRFAPAHDRGSSHGRTRMIRQAYFEHPDYVPMVQRAFSQWAELSERRGSPLYHEVGLLQVGPRDGVVLPGVLASARTHGLEIEELSAAAVEKRWRGFRVPRHLAALFERRAGYLDVEDCVLAHLDEARRMGAELRIGETVRRWEATRDRVTVETDRGRYHAERLIIAAGPWAGQLLAELGLPLEVRRKPMFWYEATSNVYSCEQQSPAFLFELPAGIYYGFPQIDELGVKVAEHSGGTVVADPLTVNRDIDAVDRSRVEQFAAEHLPALTRRLTAHSVCMYTMTHDEHFIVDRHPTHANVVFAAGLSGHGFKFAGVLGEALADLVCDRPTAAPMDFLHLNRPALRA